MASHPYRRPVMDGGLYYVRHKQVNISKDKNIRKSEQSRSTLPSDKEVTEMTDLRRPISDMRTTNNSSHLDPGVLETGGDVPDFCSVEMTDHSWLTMHYYLSGDMIRSSKDEDNLTVDRLPRTESNENIGDYQNVIDCNTESKTTSSCTNTRPKYIPPDEIDDFMGAHQWVNENKTNSVDLSEQNKLICMKKEVNRLHTFRDWPKYCSFVSAEDLAKAGLYYIGPGDRVRCVYCLNILKMWEEGDDPQTEHDRENPECERSEMEDVLSHQRWMYTGST